MKVIGYILINTVAIGVAAYILPGIRVDSIISAITLAIVLGIINIFIKPILVLLTLPLTILTLGVFIFVINALLIMLASIVVPGFGVENFWWALLFSLVISIVSWFLSQMSKSTQPLS